MDSNMQENAGSKERNTAMVLKGGASLVGAKIAGAFAPEGHEGRGAQRTLEGGGGRVECENLAQGRDIWQKNG